MTLEEIMQELAAAATPQTKKTYLRHGAPEPVFGVRVGDLKPLQKKLKGEQRLAMELYATKNSDAMYLAGLIADGSKMTRRELDQWANGATWHMIAGSSVPWVACEHPQAVAVACRWIDSTRVDMGETNCKVPDAASYILKGRRGAQVAPKRRTTRC